ncbi:anaphase promoting complex subunit cdc16 [Actinomortierella wolfii]|nr:anaphase promoting complex subunit cdc16 [Actinomortierella wolfii]
MPSTPQRHAAANARSSLSRNPNTTSRRAGGTSGIGRRTGALSPPREHERRNRSLQGNANATGTNSNNNVHANNNNNPSAASSSNTDRNSGRGGHYEVTTPVRQRTVSSRSTGSTSSNATGNNNSWIASSPTSATFVSPTRSSTRLHHGNNNGNSGGSGGAPGSTGPSPTLGTPTTTTPSPADRGTPTTTTSSSRRLRNPPGNPSPRASLRRGGASGSSGSMSNLSLSQSSLIDLSPTSVGGAGGAGVGMSGGGGIGGGVGGGIGGSGPRTPGLQGNSSNLNRLGYPASQQSMRVIPSPIANSPAGWNETQFAPVTPGRGGGGTGSRTWYQYSQQHPTPGIITGSGGDESIDSNASVDSISAVNNIFAPVAIDRDQLSIENMRSWRIDATHQHLYKTAAYWGDKVLSITDDPNDVFWLSQIYFDTGEYARAINLLQHQELIHTSVACRFLATQCFLEASLCHLRGVVFKNLNNIQRAKECFIEALQIDIKCYEALDALVSNSMLTITEVRCMLTTYHDFFDRIERELIESLEFNKQLIGQDATFVKMLYQSKLKKYDHAEAQNEIYQSLEAKFRLENADLIYSRAEIYFAQSRFEQCLECTKRILQRDRFNLDCVPMHLVCLYELDMKNDLFLLVHDLVDQHPNHAVAWFGVGVYYYLIGNMAEARRYFSKSSTIDSHYGPAWIGFGHSFAAEGEHDQAIAAYATSSKLLQGSHLGPMYIGMQHLQQNNTLLAQKYLTSCLVLCDKDPLLLNELGVMHYNLGEYEQAVECFDKVVQMLELSQRKNVIWETTWLNLGHAHRKLGHYEEAETYYLKVDAVAMGGSHSSSGVSGGGGGGCSGNSSNDTKASALVALGFVYQIMGRLNDAIDAYHKVLAIRPSDQVASDMLQRVMEDKIRESEQEWFASALPQELQTDESVHHLLAIRERTQSVKERVLKRLHGRPLANQPHDVAHDEDGTIEEEEEGGANKDESDTRLSKQPRITEITGALDDDMRRTPPSDGK